MSPATALAVGLKVDVDALPRRLQNDLAKGRVDLEMGGKGTFFDPRLDDADKFPVAARARLGHVRNSPDLITSKLPALHLYQLALAAPKPAEGSFDAVAAARGKTLFENKAQCASCHVAPLTGLFTHEKGGFYHDGRFATLAEVISHYDSFLQLSLSAQEKTDLAEYLRSL